MARAQKICRVCGKPYEACRTAKQTEGVFRWQDVACSPECGTEYLRLVNEARGIQPREKRKTRKTDINDTISAIDVKANETE